MAYRWNSALETGHRVIDSQHKELIQAINNLLTACQQGQTTNKAGATLDSLVSYTKRHFGEEENIATAIRLPGLSTPQEIS